MTTSIGECRISTIFGPLDSTTRLRIEQADEHIRIAHELLEQVNHPDVSYGDGILTIRAINGTVSYGVGALDLESMTHEGTRSGSWQI
jgi:hypothetical protein